MRFDCRRLLLVAAALSGLAFQAGSPPQSPTPAAAPAQVPPRQRGPAIPSVSRRVVLLSLDGASSETLHQLYRSGSLSGGGFSRFFREGMVADALVPFDPTLTSPNHISLATGYPPSGTGIVSNRFHPAGAPFLDRVSGFDTPIGAETLWEAARRQKRRAGVLTWPGADGTNARRTADWGLIYVNAAERDPRIVTLSRADWHAAQPPAGGTPLASKSPLLAAQAGLGGQGGPVFDLFAVGNAPGSYDGIVVALRSRRGGSPGEAQVTPPLRRGEWGSLSVVAGGERTVCRIKVLDLDPALASARLYFGGLFRTRAYPPSFAKELAAADLFWPGPPDSASLDAGWRGKEGINLGTWSEQSERFAGFFGDVLRLGAGRPDWELLMGYMPVIDEAGHELLLVDPRQPGFSAERRDALARARLRVWQAVDRELRRLLATLDLKRTTVVVVSDHGMAPVHTALDANVLLRQKGLLASSGGGGEAAPARGVSAYAVGDGGIAHVYIAGEAAARESALAALRVLFTGWRVGEEAPIERVVSRAEAAELGLDHPNSGELILFAREGYSFDPAAEGKGEAAYPASVHGMHGYLSAHPAMHAIYLAMGGEVKPEAAAKLRTTDVVARISAWLGIEKPRPQPPPAR